MEYAYLGEVTNGEFDDIRMFFPMIVGIGASVNYGTVMIALGVPKNLPDNVIGLYQLIVLCWNDKEARQKAFDAASEL